MKKALAVKINTEKIIDLTELKPDSDPKSTFGRKIIFALALTLIVTGANMYSLRNDRQFELMSGMAEEYFSLGVIMYYTGNFYLSDSAKNPFVFRPPGYAKYIDLVLKTYGGMKPKGYRFHSKDEFELEYKHILNVVYFSQCLLNILSSLILFLLLSELLNMFLAFGLSVMFGINPYLIMLGGMVHYETLHIFMILLSTWLTYLAFTRKKFGLIFLFSAGIFWGLTTLIRPVTLILPVLFAIVLFLYFRRDLKTLLLYFLIFIIGFVGIISPYTYRNYKLVHRFIPVNAQTNISFWAGSSKSLNIDANHYRWWEIWYPEGQNNFEKMTGTTGFQTYVYADHVLEFEDFYKKEFKKNISENPMVYIGNVCKNFLLLNFGINSVFIKMFQYKQNNNDEIDKNWLKTGDPQDFYSSYAANAFTILIFIMSIMSLCGIYLAVKNKDYIIYIPLMAFLAIAISHSITYMDLMYYYVRIPFIFIFTAFFIKHIGFVFKKSITDLLQKIITISLVVGMFILYMVVII
jgi:hypothetical protein